MKKIIHIFRDFTKNLLIYMAGEAPKIDYQPKLEKLGVEGVKEKFGKKEEPLKGEKFEGMKQKAEKMIKKISLDANPDVQTQAEKELMQKLLKHNEEQFRLLEHNYRVAENELGATREKMQPVEKILDKATHEFIKKLQVHIFKESAEKGTTEARGEMIDAFLKERGIYMKGLGRYIVKGNWDIFGKGGSFEDAIQNLKTREEIDKKLEEIINQKHADIKNSVLHRAIWAMRKDLPKFEASNDELNYFQKRVTTKPIY